MIVQYLGADNYAGGKQGAEMVLKDLGADATLKIGFVTEPDEVPTVRTQSGLRRCHQGQPNAEESLRRSATCDRMTA